REPSRPGSVQPDRTLLWSVSVRPDTARPGWLAEPADSDEGSGTTPPVGRIPAPSGSHGHRRVCVAKWTPFTPQGWCPGSLVAVGGRSQAGRAGGVQPSVSAGQQV